MRELKLLLLLITASLAPAADRVVIFEDFTNSGCSPCWNIETQINAFVASHIASGTLAVIRTHVNWPSAGDPIYLANPTEQTVRKAQYGVQSVPYLIFDGIQVTAAPSLESHFNNRLNTPAYIDIMVARNGDETSGTVSIRIIAEQEPQWQEGTVMRVWPILVEDNIPGVGYWAGSVFEQAFRDNLLGPYGEVVEFAAPYPDTIFVDAEYTVAPSWDANSLFLATFLQCTYQQGDHEVPNADWQKFLDIPQGLEDGFTPFGPVLTVTPNPGSGAFTAFSVLPEGSTGTLQVFDLAGRTVLTSPAGEQTGFALAESGVYFVRLLTDTGTSVIRTIAVIR